MDGKQTERLLVLWTSGEKETALNMVFMYSVNAMRFGWWPSVTVLVWGAATRLAAADAAVQAQIALAREHGVRVIACKKCAENLGAVEALEGLGIEVFYTGEFLTEWLKSGERILSI
jgi:hypothetical protein